MVVILGLKVAFETLALPGNKYLDAHSSVTCYAGYAWFGCRWRWGRSSRLFAKQPTGATLALPVLLCLSNIMSCVTAFNL